jgi:Ion transport protein
VFKYFYSIAISEIFTGIIFLTTTLNTIVIMMDKYPYSEQESEFQELANNVFYFIFLLEMIVKVIGLGFFNYLRDGYNIFDAFIIICSTIEIVL